MEDEKPIKPKHQKHQPQEDTLTYVAKVREEGPEDPTRTRKSLQSVYKSSDVELVQSLSIDISSDSELVANTSSDADSSDPTITCTALDIDPAVSVSNDIVLDASLTPSMSMYTSSDAEPISSELQSESTNAQLDTLEISEIIKIFDPDCTICLRKATNQTATASWFCHQCEDLLCEECRLDHNTLKEAKDHIVSTLNPPCDLCERRKLTVKSQVWCEDCSEFLCVECKSKHKLFRLSANHSISSCEDKIRNQNKGINEQARQGGRPFSQRQAKLKSTFHVKVEDDNYTPSIVSSSVLPDGRILLLDQANMSLKMFSKKFTFIARKEFKTKPRNLAVYDASDMAVTHQGYTVSKMSVDGNIIKKRKHFLIDLICIGIDYLDKDRLVITGTEKPSIMGFVKYMGSFTTRRTGLVFVCNMEGVQLHRLKTDDICDLTYLNPINVISDRQRGRVYITNRQADTVFCLDAHFLLTGEMKLKFTYTSDKLKDPIGLEIDQEGNVYVCVVGSQNLQQISPDGEHIQTVLAKQNGVKALATMAFDSSGELFILGRSSKDSDSEKVQVYMMQ